MKRPVGEPEGTVSFGAMVRDILRVLRLALPYRNRLVAAVVFSVVGVGFSLLVPLGLKELIDTALDASDRGLLDLLALGVLAVLVLQAAANFVGDYLLRWTGERVVADLRKKVYRHLHRLSPRFYVEEETGDLTSRLTNDVGSVRQAVTSALARLVTQSLRLIGSVGILMALSWRLGLLVVAAAPGAAVASRVLGSRLRKVSREVQDDLARTSNLAEQSLSAIRVVLAFARGSYETERYSDAVEDLFEAARTRVVYVALLRTTVVLLFYAAMALVFWYGGIRVMAGELTAGDLVASLFYGLTITTGVASLSGIYGTFARAAGASERLFEILDTVPAVREAPDAIDLDGVEGRVAFDDVSFAYDPDDPVLRGVELEVAPGELVALVGPSGAGKTTLLQLIPRFFDPDEGRIRLDGHDVRTVTLESLRREVAVVTQEILLFGGSVRENIRYGRLDADDREIEEAARAARAHEFVRELPEGYDSVVGERGVKLSAGQRQRVALARAYLSRASVLLLDEATSFLDGRTEQNVRSALVRGLESDPAVIVVSHRLSTVRDADRILVLEDGRVVEEGSHRSLIRAGGAYARLMDVTGTDGRSSSGRASRRSGVRPGGDMSG